MKNPNFDTENMHVADAKHREQYTYIESRFSILDFDSETPKRKPSGISGYFTHKRNMYERKNNSEILVGRDHKSFYIRANGTSTLHKISDGLERIGKMSIVALRNMNGLTIISIA